MSEQFPSKASLLGTEISKLAPFQMGCLEDDPASGIGVSVLTKNQGSQTLWKKLRQGKYLDSHNILGPDFANCAVCRMVF